MGPLSALSSLTFLAILSFPNSLLIKSSFSYISKRKLLLLLLLYNSADKLPHLHGKIRGILKTVIISIVVNEICS